MRSPNEGGDDSRAEPNASHEELGHEGEFDALPSLSSSGPLSSSARVAILASLLVLKRTTFTDLMLAVSVPRSSLSRSLAILKDGKFVTVKKGFWDMGGPRTIIEITPEGEKAIRDHLVLMQDLAKRLLPSQKEE